MSSDDLPPFPAPPPEVPRFEHPPTVERGLRYWSEVWLRSAPDSPAADTAITLASLYASAVEALGVRPRGPGECEPRRSKPDRSTRS